MEKVLVENNCTGCHACAQTCPKKCISMQQDGEGFLYPKINENLCINCGLCKKICPVFNCVKEGREPQTAYAAYALDETVRLKSSSGGVFTLLAENIIALGGAVFGAAFDEEQQLKHICVDTAEDLEKLRGSKYVQSEIGTSYVEAKKYLDSGRFVLFTGTPCQIAGLYAYIRKDYDNLYTQDIICHGVPSPLVWQKYVEYRETIAGAKTQKIVFRDKTESWKKYSLRFDFKNSKEYIHNQGKDLYMKSFLKNLCLRPSCYECGFKGPRQSDITLADFWGIWNIIPEMNDDKGCSLVLVNSEKGQHLFTHVKAEIRCAEVDRQQALKYNTAYFHSAPLPSGREKFISRVLSSGFESAKNLVNEPFLKRAVRKAVRILKKIFGR